MAEKKRQHIIPACYLRSWCDPRKPPAHHPFIWRIRKDRSAKQKRSPEKSFRATDKYTIRLPNGQRNLVFENTLAETETLFVRVICKIRKRQKLSPTDRAHLCLFAAAMHNRTTATGEHWKRQMQRLHEVVVDLEQAHNSPPRKSLETAHMVETAHHDVIANGLRFETPLLFQMQMTVLMTDDELGFVTSDRPCLWFNPQAYKWPPFYRSPGLAQRDIEVTLPLSPEHALLVCHRSVPQYSLVTQQVVDELNRRTVLNCTEEFVSWKGEMRDYWFDPGQLLADSWENSEVGKRALARHALEAAATQRDHEE